MENPERESESADTDSTTTSASSSTCVGVATAREAIKHVGGPGYCLCFVQEVFSFLGSGRAMHAQCAGCL